MAACADGTSSEKFLSDVTSENECNFYDSDVGETSVASMDVGPHPYRFKPHRIRHNVEHERINNNEEQTEWNESLGEHRQVIVSLFISSTFFSVLFTFGMNDINSFLLMF